MRAQQERAVAQEDEARAREVDPDTLDDEGEPRGDRVGTDQLRTDQREPNRAQASCAHEAGPVRGGLPRPSSAHTRVEVRRRKLRPRD